jgi:hypothetical protein
LYVVVPPVAWAAAVPVLDVHEVKVAVGATVRALAGCVTVAVAVTVRPVEVTVTVYVAAATLLIVAVVAPLLQR